MSATVKPFHSPLAMLQWQYREIIGELQELARHAADPTCPCVQADTGEYCLPKHSLGVSVLARETASMDKANTAMLSDLAEEALELHNALKDRIVCHQPHKDEPDAVEWARAWRKRLEPLYYKGACGTGRAKLHEDTIGECSGAACSLSLAQEPKVSIRGTCSGDACAIKVKATETMETQSTATELPAAIKAVVKEWEAKRGTKASAETYAIGPTSLTRYHFRYRLVELDSLVISHDEESFAVNPKYPPELQPRLRERAATRLQVMQMAVNINPDALLTEFHSLDRGAPIIGSDRIVESGNGRVMALRRAIAHHPESYAAYREALRTVAPQYALSAKSVNSMAAPVLVRERLDKVDRKAFAEETNATTTIASSAIETARTDAKLITVNDIMGIQVGEGQSIEDALRAGVNRPFVSAFLAKLPSNDQARMVGADGSLSADGLRRMVLALFVATFTGDVGLRLAERFFESTELSVRNVFNGITMALGKLAQAESLVVAGMRNAALAIGEDLAGVVAVFARIKATPGMTVEKYLAQGQLGTRELSPFQEKLLAALDARSRSGKAIGAMLSAYSQAVLDSPPPQQGGLMGLGPVDKALTWDAAMRRIERETVTLTAPCALERIRGIDRCNLSCEDQGQIIGWRPLREFVTGAVKFGKVIICQAGMVVGAVQVTIDLSRSKDHMSAASALQNAANRVPGMRRVFTPGRELVYQVVLPSFEARPEDLLGGKQYVDVPEVRGERGEQVRMFACGNNGGNCADLEQPRGYSKKQWEDVLRYQMPFGPEPTTAPPKITSPCAPCAPCQPCAPCPQYSVPEPIAVDIPTPMPSERSTVKPGIQLFPFQQEGVAWLKGRSYALLADDMGLGKTPQAIHWGADFRPVLVVVPSALTFNWVREITAMWRIGDTAVLLDGSNELPKPLPDWTVLSYGMLPKYLPALKRAGFRALIIDEAHLVKNIQAQRTQNILELVAPLEPQRGDKPIHNRLAVTGTPILNRPIEMFALLVFLGVKQRSDLAEFMREYTEHKTVRGRTVFTGAKNLAGLHDSLKPFMLRRLKKDVLTKLPPKIHTPLFVAISNSVEYREAERNFLSWLRGRQGNEAALRAARAEIIAQMNALRQIASVGKVAAVCDWLKPCRDGQGKVLVFSSFTRPLEALKRCKPDSVVYDGSLSSSERQAIVDSFQKTGQACYFLGTIGAAGVGITLTTANRVAFLDLPWTPGAKAQAEDRAHRIGQTRTVEVVNVLAKGTIDERMLAILAEKEKVIAQAVDGKTKDEAASTSISESLVQDFLRRPAVAGLSQYVPEEAEPDLTQLEIVEGTDQLAPWQLAHFRQDFTYPEHVPQPRMIHAGPGLTGVVPEHLMPTKVETQLIRSKDWDRHKVLTITAPGHLAPIVQNMRGAAQEWMIAVYMDTKGHVVAVDEIAQGTRDSALAPIDAILRGALMVNASRIILAHNHPSGDPMPSAEDRKLFEDVKQAARLVDLEVLDMLVVGDRDDYSIRGDAGIVPMAVSGEYAFTVKPPKAMRGPEGQGRLMERQTRPRCTPAQAEKVERCIVDVKAMNAEAGCDGRWGTKGCPNPFAVCQTSIGCARVPSSAALGASKKCPWEVTVRKCGSTWSYYTQNDACGGFGSTVVGTKKEAVARALVGIPRGTSISIITKDCYQTREISRAVRLREEADESCPFPMTA